MKRFSLIILALAVFCSLSFTALGYSPKAKALPNSNYALNDKGPGPNEQGPNQPGPKRKAPSKKKAPKKRAPKPKQGPPRDDKQPRGRQQGHDQQQPPRDDQQPHD
ncbi:MAG TPA: hypothetical protein DDW50_10135 [Firmicutes bacterium]|jgi:hypothetical protein|nr:hypothetical protein [Bacillota bacterium]